MSVKRDNTAPGQNRQKHTHSMMFRQRLKNTKANILPIYRKVLKDTGAVTIENASYLLEEILAACQVDILESELVDQTKNFTEVFLPQEMADTTQFKNFTHFWSLVSEWYESTGLGLKLMADDASNKTKSMDIAPQNIQVDFEFINITKKHIEEYQNMLEQQPELRSYIMAIMQEIQKQQQKFRAIKRKRTETPSVLSGQEPEESLKAYFAWYAAQHKSYGSKHTFDDIKTNKEIMDMGSFQRFCKDFTLFTDAKQSDKRYLTKKEVMDIFKKNALYQRDLRMENFREAIDTLAEVYYNQEFDKKNPGQFMSNKSLEDKRFQLFEKMRLGNMRYHRKIRNAFGMAFSNTKPRISRDETFLKKKFKPTQPVELNLSWFRDERIIKKIKDKATNARQRYASIINQSKSRNVQSHSVIQTKPRIAPKKAALSIKDMHDLSMKHLLVSKKDYEDILGSSDSEDEYAYYN